MRAKTLRQQSGGVDVALDRIHIHPEYDNDTVANDIAVINIAEALSDIKPAVLPESEDAPAADSSVTLVGWGSLREGASLSVTLQYVDVPVIDAELCRQRYESQPDIVVGSNEFCDGGEFGGKGACQGDGGGPALSGDQVVGIISRGGGCARPGYPEVNTAVGPYLDWIYSIVES